MQRPVDLIAVPALMLVAVCLAAATPGIGSAQQQVRVIQREPPAGRDSLVDRILAAKTSEVQQMIVLWRAREDQLVRELRSAPEGDAATRQRLNTELMRLTREGFTMMSAIEAKCRDEAMPRPSGYLGVNIEQQISITGGEVRTADNRLTSVEPGSPAQAAGLRPGDRLLAIGGRDARTELPDLGALLVPGRMVVVRVERDGTPRDFPATIVRRPAGFGDSCGEFEAMLQPLRMAAPGRVFIESPTMQRRVVVERGSGETPRGSGEEARFSFFGTGASNQTTVGFFAGAEFRALDDGWRDVLGVKQGVLVNEVASGSSAAQSGLRSGDVITAVDDAAVTTPGGLVQLLAMLERNEAKLSVVRGKEKKTLTLRWGSR